MKLSEFDYSLPKDLIAQNPLPSRDSSRLMVLNRIDNSIDHNIFSNFPDYLHDGDLLIMNNTKVFPARLIGNKKISGGKVELLLIHETGPQIWRAMLKSSGKIKDNTEITFNSNNISAVVLEKYKNKLGGKDCGAEWLIKFESEEDVKNIMDKIGYVPLPPYIKRSTDRPSSAMDKERYQTVYASKSGAIAAPTAGLHFTNEILNRIKKKGVKTAEVTLHVGTGTFKPVKTEFIQQHSMEPEYFEISDASEKKIRRAIKDRGRIIAVGTTTTRTIESVKIKGDRIEPQRGKTNLFVYPGFNFRFVDSLLTNFHLPESTLLMLVHAFTGKELAEKAYREAVEKKYRFFSYGDAMLIF